jgi:hypothetical protein
MKDSEPLRISRREALRWVLAAGGSTALIGPHAWAASGAQPYGRDAALNRAYAAGDLWPLTLTAPQRRAVVALCDLIIPADEISPAASAVGVPDFIDEWISAPYADQQFHRQIVLDGLRWLDGESRRRFGDDFATLDTVRQSSIADDICRQDRAQPEFRAGAQFFEVMRSLVSTGFYTTTTGWKDVGFVGNVALTAFPDPPAAVLKKLGLDG